MVEEVVYKVKGYQGFLLSERLQPIWGDRFHTQEATVKLTYKVT